MSTTFDASDDQAPADPAPMTRHGQIEVDTFCTNCFYNLHGQVVMIDDRLKIPVCRCPECGKFAPAGVGVTASSIWVRRLAVILLFWWVLIVTSMTVASLFAMGGLEAASVEPFVHSSIITDDGRTVEQIYAKNSYHTVFEGTTTDFTGHARRAILFDKFDTDEQRLGAFYALLMISAASVALGLVVGTLAVTFLWHWPRRRYFLLLLLPLIPTSILVVGYAKNEAYDFIRGQCDFRVAEQTSLVLVGMLLGVIFGRMVARTVLRVVVPPKPRQALAFLWTIDGRKMPGSSVDPSATSSR